MFKAVSCWVGAISTGGELPPVVGQGGLWVAVHRGCGGEAFDDVANGGVWVSPAGDDVSGVVIKDSQDGDASMTCECPVAVVHLPCFVGLVGLEADPGAAGAFLGLRGDAAVVGKYSVDCVARSCLVTPW